MSSQIELDEEMADNLGAPNVYYASFLERLGRLLEIFEFPVDVLISEHSKAEALLRAHEMQVDLDYQTDHGDIVVGDTDDYTRALRVNPQRSL